MILGITLHLYTQIHVFISLAAILSGLVAVLGMLIGKPVPSDDRASSSPPPSSPA